MKIRKYVPEFIILVYAILFLLTKSPSDQWDKVIVSDGKGYYAYLTAFFIYNDPDYKFIDQYESDYYPAGRELFKDFRFDTGKGIVNKYFPGPAILWVPFFGLGHAVAIILGFPADGYSLPYQLAISFAAFFYFWLSLLILRKVLRFYTENENAIAWVLIAVALATNLIYYTVNNGSQVHVYNFFLINVFIFSVLSVCRSGKQGYYTAAAFSLGMIIICRPQNGLIVLSLPFLCGSRASFVKYFRDVFTSPRIFIPAFVLLLLPLLVPVIYWYTETGQLFIYSYGTESFDLTKPHLWKFLFSFEKGWLLYTPVAALALSGFIFLYRKNRWQFFGLAGFLFFLVYFMSSWWIWNYTSFVSQRVMIDYYAFVAILLIFLFQWNENNRKRILFPILLSGLIGLNLMQHFQHLIWVYPTGPVTAGSYYGNFFSFSKSSTYMIPESEIRGRQIYKTGFENNEPLFQAGDLVSVSSAYSGEKALELVSGFESRVVFVREMSDFKEIQPMILRIGAWFKPEAIDSSLTIEIKIGTSKKKYSTNSRNLMPGLRTGQWKYAEMAVYLPYIRSVSDSLFISVQNLNRGKVMLDDLQIELLKMKGPDKHDWIPASYDPVDSARVYRTDLETRVELPWSNAASINSGISYSGKNASGINLSNPYSIVFENKLLADINKDGYIRVSSKVLGDISAEINLVFDFTTDGKTVFYKAYPVALRGNDEQWSISEIFREFPVAGFKAQKVRIYYWYRNGGKTVYIDDMQVDIVQYKQAELVTQPQLEVSKSSEILFEKCCDFENDCKPQSGLIAEVTGAYSGKKVCIINSDQPYSYSHWMPLSELKINTDASIYITAMGNSDHYQTEAILVADFKQGGKSYSYYPAYLRGRTIKGQWNPVDFNVKIPSGITTKDSVLVYFYLPDSDEVFMIDDFCVSLGRNLRQD